MKKKKIISYLHQMQIEINELDNKLRQACQGTKGRIRIEWLERKRKRRNA